MKHEVSVRRVAAAVAALMLVMARGAPAQTRHTSRAESGAATPAKGPSALKGLVFLADPTAVVPPGWPVRTSVPATASVAIDVSRVPALADPRATALLSPFIGQPLDMALLVRIQAALARYFNGIGRPFVRVTIPPQGVTNGFLQVVIVQGRLGTLKVSGNRWFSAHEYLAPLHLAPGQPIDAPVLDDAIRWLNRNPYRHVAPIATAGQAFGTTDLTLQVQDRLPLSVTGGVGNTGNAVTGETQLSAGVDWGNALWRGDDLNVHYTTGTDLRVLHQYSAGYIANLPWGDQVLLSGGYSRTRPVSAPGAGAIGSLGTMANVSPRYVRSLGPARAGRLSAGFDWKRTNNDLLFGGQSVFTSSASVAQFLAGYSTSFGTRLGSTSADVTIAYSPGGLSARNTDAAFGAQREGAKARYAYLHASIDELVPLRRGFAWDVRVTGQVSDARLLSTEQLAFGGDGSVRGFQTFAVTRDNGLILNTELRAPAVRVLSRLGARSVADQLDALVFFDYGAGGQHRQAAPRLRLASIGPGLRYQFSRFASVQLAYGRVLQHDGVPAQAGGRLHFQVQTTF